MTHDESSLISAKAFDSVSEVKNFPPERIDSFLYSCPCPPNSGLYVKINLFQIVTDVGYKTNYKTIS